ncbi:MAG: NADH-quinone oxidoreductase subunit C [Coriobacteriales bacterium]|jgi:ech hydrogenase subunit D|nr:NADH-quinone oxidoreductase subunit C [Coriobacteriales bacterium]
MDPQVFIDIQLDELKGHIASYHERGWRLANLCGSSVDDKVELLYSFAQGPELENLRMLVDNGQKIPAVSPLYPNAFVFENEASELYGVVFEGGLVDYGGRFYSPSVPTPMNPASLPAQEYLASARAAADAEDEQEKQGAEEQGAEEQEEGEKEVPRG